MFSTTDERLPGRTATSRSSLALSNGDRLTYVAQINVSYVCCVRTTASFETERTGLSSLAFRISFA